jgi:hypothetical protein
LTGFVQGERTAVDPEAFEAITTTRSRWPTSVELTTYVDFVARATLTHLRPLLQRCQA